MTGGEPRADLEGGLGEHRLKAKAEGGAESPAEALGRGCNLLVADVAERGELAAQGFDVGFEFHVMSL